MEKGYITMVLHAHLPYVRHPEYKYFLEENWLFEAINETYLPLLHAFERMAHDRVNFKLTMSLTPTLLAMLSDPLLQERYVKHLDALIELAEKEVVRTRLMPDLNKVAVMYLDKFILNRKTFVNQYNNNIIEGFKKFHYSGNLEIITCCATHGFLPLMSVNERAVEAQIKIAVDSHIRHIGKAPKGIWLAECGYFPGHDKVLKKYGIQYFFTDTHGILHGSPRPKYGVFAPVFCDSGVAAFGRDIESSRSVWSANEGYPGDYNYREFYRDVGYDLDLDYIRPYIHPDGIRINTGIKYYKITGKTQEKQVYDPEKALHMAREHAANFHFNRVKQVEHLNQYMDRKPLVVSPYDAELFGHWWYEGPSFVEQFLRMSCDSRSAIKAITPPEYLEMYPKNQIVTPSFSSWGHKGYSEVWLSPSNDWIYPHLIEISERMVELATHYQNQSSDLLVNRALAQAARELLLAQSSDWAFIIRNNTTVEYAEKRTKDHVNRFNSLYEQIKDRRINPEFLQALEYHDNIFPDIDYRIYAV
ncbi:MAG TPA: DUF1957 domain-containing protein [Candidatus Wallbacteria bacterium]|nr:DUF1957 domain-containing protein [Candidatus Wallbacteria bacterium]